MSPIDRPFHRLNNTCGRPCACAQDIPTESGPVPNGATRTASRRQAWTSRHRSVRGSVTLSGRALLESLLVGPVGQPHVDVTLDQRLECVAKLPVFILAAFCPLFRQIILFD